MRTRSIRRMVAASAVAMAAAVLAPIATPAAQAGNPIPVGDTYVPMTPCRIVDTRLAEGRFADREIRDYTVSGGGPMFANQGGKEGGCDIPLGISAIEATVTAVDPLDSGFFRAWPNGESMPNATFMNFDEGMDISNTGSITVADGLGPSTSGVGTNDFASPQLRARNFGGASHYVIDVQGYWIDPAFTSSPTDYTAITPCRVLDTRQVGNPAPKVQDRQILDINVSFQSSVELQGGKDGGCGIPQGAVGIEASVSAVDPDGSGFFRAWPADESMPNATFMNFDRGMDITNTGSLTINPYDEQPLRLRNFGGRAHYVVDIQGYYTTGAGLGAEATTSATSDEALYVAITPCRIVDTRQAGGALVDREIRDVEVVGDGPGFAAQGGLPDGCGIPTDTVAVEASIAAVDPTDSGFFRAWPFGQSMPNATFMNFDRGMDITNTGSITIDPDDDQYLRIRDFGGTSHYVIDIQGYWLPA